MEDINFGDFTPLEIQKCDGGRGGGSLFPSLVVVDVSYFPFKLRFLIFVYSYNNKGRRTNTNTHIHTQENKLREKTTTFPSSMTRILSESSTVMSRCAMVSVVQSLKAVRIVCCIKLSVSVSMAAVASSKNRI